MIVPQAGGWAARGDGSILVQREVSAPLVIVGEVVLWRCNERSFHTIT